MLLFKIPRNLRLPEVRIIKRELYEKSRRHPNLKNRTAPEIEKAVLEMAIEEPAWGQTRVSNELRRKVLNISPGGVRSVWIRGNLETMKKRLKALEEKVAKEGGVLLM